jgi:AcrR family transcriptional regulator
VPVAHHGNRHGRSEAARIAVLKAADNLLVERGFADLTVENIAAHAHVAKQTIYRWWPSKTDILFEALILDAEEHFSIRDHGDLRSDLRDHLRQVAAFLTRTDAGAVYLALLGVAQHDPVVAARLRTGFTEPERARGRALLLRARRRGELPEAEDIDAAVEQLLGPIYYRVVVGGQPVPCTFTDGLVDRYMDRIGNLRRAVDRESGEKPAART